MLKKHIDESSLGYSLPKIKTSSVPGPEASRILKRRLQAIPAAIRTSYPLVIKRGQGAMVEDVDGNLFLDWVGGVGVLNIGYSNKEVIEAVKQQSELYFHSMMNIITHEGYISLAEKLNQIVPVRQNERKTMLVNSGAEAVENAVKIARAHTGREGVIVFTGAFHGRTSLAMQMTANKAYSKGMGPFPSGVYRAAFPDLLRKTASEASEIAEINCALSNLEQIILENEGEIAAIVVEPVQGEGGFVPAPFEWIKKIRTLCDKEGILLIADEIQTGFARSGRMFVSNYWAENGYAPDIIIMAKSIAGGIPLSAVTTGANIMDSVPAGTIGGTYNGNPLACAAALEVIRIIEEENYCEKARTIAEFCKIRFLAWKTKWDQIADVRGIGAMMGIEFVKDKNTLDYNGGVVTALVNLCAQNGLIIESAGEHGNIVRFLCPLCVTEKQLVAGLDIMESALISLLD